MYIHERKDWPNFKWDDLAINKSLIAVRHLQGRLLGQMEALGFSLMKETTFDMLTQDVLKTSEIEGEKLDIQQVRSSIAKRLGIELGALPTIDRHVEGIVEIMVDATQNYFAPLTQIRLFHWHKTLFPVNEKGWRNIKGGMWRTKKSGDMQVVSGPIGREKIHFIAPSYDRLPNEMHKFIKWFNASPDIDLIIQSALAHFWFVTIHPFEDGNGRIARALADMVLARSENSKQRFYSMSSQIQRERNRYYEMLEHCQKDSLDLTAWIEWYLGCLMRAMLASEQQIFVILNKTNFWSYHSKEMFNARQSTMINRLLDGFYGKLTSSKWAKITKCSQDTALRDINDLLQRNILSKTNAGGRSTSYELIYPAKE